MNLVKTISTEYDKLKRLVIKYTRFGKFDVQTSFESSPYGIDSNPVKDMVALYSTTGENGKTVIVGYLNKDRKAAPGEIRLFSTDDKGALKFYTWLKADGTMEVGGNTDNMVRYLKLNEGLQQEVLALNAEFAKVAAAISAIIPGLYVPTPIQLDISQSKINEVKTL